MCHGKGRGWGGESKGFERNQRKRPSSLSLSPPHPTPTPTLHWMTRALRARLDGPGDCKGPRPVAPCGSIPEGAAARKQFTVVDGALKHVRSTLVRSGKQCLSRSPFYLALYLHLWQFRLRHEVTEFVTTMIVSSVRKGQRNFLGDKGDAFDKAFCFYGWCRFNNLISSYEECVVYM